MGVLGEVDPPGEPQDGEIVIQEGSAEPRVDDDLSDGGDDFIGVSVKIPNVIAKDYLDLMGKLPVESRSTNIICRMETRHFRSRTCLAPISDCMSFKTQKKNHCLTPTHALNEDPRAQTCQHNGPPL